VNAAARRLFHEAISTQVVVAPLCLDALTARLSLGCGFKAGYVSGGALGYSHALSEALLTLDEIADTTRHITQRSDLPIIVDGGVGFGDPVHVARTIWELEATGAVAIEIEDQVAPKRVSHHRGIEHLISTQAMCEKIEQAVIHRQDPLFKIIARTGGVKNEGFDKAVIRANAYAEAGADMVMLMPSTTEEFKRAPELINKPLATITPMGQRSLQDWHEMGWSLIVDPFTAQVVATAAILDAYQRFQKSGTTGYQMEDIFKIYRQLPELAGLESLYDIEDATTLKDEPRD